MEKTVDNKRNTIVLLRWVLIIASAYLTLFGPEGPIVDMGRASFIAALLASNVFLNRMPDRWLHSRTFDMTLVVFDTGWLTASLAWSPHASEDFFMMYFLVLFVVALGESLPMIVGSATLITVVYTWGLQHNGGTQAITSAAMLRVLFLFVVALFYGYFVTALRSRSKETTEARMLERAKTDFLASISHDLRVPLGNAENYSILMLAGHYGTLPDSMRAILPRLQANIRRVSMLVINCLDASRIEAGQLHLQCSPMQLNDAVDGALELEVNAAVVKGVRIERDLASDLPEIPADMMQIGRVVANLVGNAVKYTPAGGAVTVRTRALPDAVCLEVQDNGPGIAPAEQSTVFDRYERLRGNRDLSGTGLGLFIVKTLVLAHGGAVSLRSVVGEGSTFRVTLPLGHVPSEAAVAMAV